MAKMLDLISYEGSNQELVGKVSIDDLKTKSAIIVNESQEALFYKDGQALDLFLPGRHEITTDSLPIFSKIFKHLFGTASPLPCAIYFINKVYVMDMLWGTPSTIALEDPKYHLLVNVGSNGSMGVRISDSRKFVIKIVGQVHSVSADDIRRYIKGVMMATIKDCIANVIIKEGVSILEIQTRLLELSQKMQQKINETIAPEWGIELVNFYFNNIAASDSELETLRRAKEKYVASMHDIEIESTKTLRLGQAEAQVKLQQGLIDAQLMIAQGKAEKEVLDALGAAGWDKLHAADVFKTFAQNQSNGMAAMGAEFGMGKAIAGALSGMVNSSAQSLTPTPTPEPAPASAPTPAPAPEATQSDPVVVLGKLKQLLDAGLITEEEYAQKKKEVLSRM